MPRVRHSLVIHHPSEDAVLLARHHGVHVLPVVITEDRHTAEVDHINAAIRVELGISTVFLRSLLHDRTDADPVERRHEVVARNAELRSDPPMSWCARRSLAAIAPHLVEVATPPAPRQGCGWERASWWNQATDWIGGVLAEQGIALIEIVQLRAWPSSSVLLVRSSGGDFYFKAVADHLARECDLTVNLARHFPACMPVVVAHDRTQHWFLMCAVPGRNLEGIDNVDDWEHAARTYGRLQAAALRHTESLQTCGAHRRDLSALERGFEHVAGARPEARAQLATLRLHIAELAGYEIPLTIEHGDLWPGNFILDGARCVIIDWEEASIGHPFFSMAPFLVGLREYQPGLATPAVTERILAAYLDAFAGVDSPARLRAALDHAIPLAFCDMAVRYQQQPPSMVRLHPWMRDLVPEALRRALEPLLVRRATREL